MTWPAWLVSRGASQDAVRLMTIGGDSNDLSALYVLRQFALLRRVGTFFKIRGGITYMVDVTLMQAGAFGYVPTPALVAPI